MNGNLDRLFENEIVVYGAGSTGHRVCKMLEQIGIVSRIVLTDTFKSGFDETVGIPITAPKELRNHLSATVIVGIPEYLRPQDVEVVLKSLKILGFPDSQIILFTQFLNMFSDYPENAFTWQNYSDDAYNWNTNIYLIEQISKYIEQSDLSVVDLGAGSMNLKKFISPDIKYTPVDFKSRCDETLVCDFNKGQYPGVFADVYVLCAMLYYIDEPRRLIEESAKFADRKIIVALSNANLSQYPEVMHTHGFKNYMFFDEIADILKKYGFIPIIDITLLKVARRFVVYEKRPAL